jgi:hypothetical protein
MTKVRPLLALNIISLAVLLPFQKKIQGEEGYLLNDTAFFYLGELIEVDRTEKIFTKPSLKKTEDYVTGRFG